MFKKKEPKQCAISSVSKSDIERHCMKLWTKSEARCYITNELK
jgi:hypothetical protein